MEWMVIERPGYLGKKRDEIQAKWDREFGKGNWCLRYGIGDRLFDREFAIQLYEDAYYEYLKANPDILYWLTSSASDVYDTAPSNAGQMTYNQQETSNNHIHDIAIRRSVYRLGYTFHGNDLIHVRWTDSAGYRLNPGIVPFHLPHLIDQEGPREFETCHWAGGDGKLKDYTGKGNWWNSGTIEDFYQRNKLLIAIEP